MTFHEQMLDGFVKDRMAVACGRCGVTALWQDKEGLAYIKSLEDGHIQTDSFKNVYFVDKLSEKYLYTDSATGIKHKEYTYKISPVWETLKDRKDIYLVDKFEKCPCCGKSYDDTAVKIFGFWDELKSEYNIETLITPGSTSSSVITRGSDYAERDYRSAVSYNYPTKTAEAIYSECEKSPAAFSVISEEAVKELSVPEFIKKFIETEAVISALKERIKFLDYKLSPFVFYSNESLWEFYRNAFSNRIGIAIPLGEKRKELLNKLEMYNGAAFDPESVSISVQDAVEPKKPAPPVKPNQPELMKVTLFNKAKAAAENEKLMAEYNAALQIYINLASTFDERLATYEKDYAEYLEKHNAYLAVKEAEIAKARKAFEKEQNDPARAEKISVLENQLRELEKEFDLVPEKAMELTYKEEEREFFKAVREEMEQAKALLKKAYAARQYLKTCGVVHPKYANLVALSSIYEYYETGRTDTLTGPNGAYNLYEQDVKAEAIIESLHGIADKLEGIESAQYTILYTLQDMKENTEKLLTDIADNTARIAYNTAVTAHYTKLNSQLLDSVGMMIALK